MIKTFVLCTSLAFGLATAADAAISPAPVGGGAAIVKIAEGCGAGFWRGPGGHCHPYARGRACPGGYHLGPDARRCWPN
ncbi:MAG: GCG_CRPN prefix-to-repeats domain-containing protein [Roseiarcus sp.]